MSRDWLISALGAMLCHLAVFMGLQHSAGFSNPGQPQPPEDIEVSLVAAPIAGSDPVGEMHPSAAPSPSFPVAPSPVTPPAEPPPVHELAPMEEVIPTLASDEPEAGTAPIPEETEPPPLTNRTATLVQGAAISLSPAFIGDGTAPISGRDSATVRGKPDTLARPAYRKNPEPNYPGPARRRRQEGVVLLLVTVTPSGHPSQIELKQSSGFPSLDHAAQSAVRTWEFEPARLRGQAVESEIEIPVRFRLTN